MKPSFTKYLILGGVVVGGGAMVFGRKLWAGVAATQQMTNKMVADTARITGQVMKEADKAMTKQVDNAVVQGRKVVGETSDEAALVAAKVGLEAQDLVSVKRLVRDFLESNAEQAQRIALESEAAVWMDKILAAVRSLDSQGYLASVKLNEIAQVLLKNIQKVKAGHSGKSVLPAAFVGAAEKLLTAAAEKNVVMYPRDAYAVMATTAAKITWAVPREKLVDEETELNGLYGLLDRNAWAAKENIRVGRRMWWQMVGPKVEKEVKSFLAQVEKGQIKIYEKGFGKAELISFANFKKDYL